MGDLISRSALRDRFYKECCGECYRCEHENNEYNCNLIEEQPTVEAEPVVHGEWIPVSEKLPEGDVLCCNAYKNLMIGEIMEDEESNTRYSAVGDGCYMYDVVAYMPLPEPYKEEQN